MAFKYVSTATASTETWFDDNNLESATSYQDTTQTLTESSGTYTWNLLNGVMATIAPPSTGPYTVSITNEKTAANQGTTCVLFVNSTSNVTLNFNDTINWGNGSSTTSYTTSGRTILMFNVVEGGASWYGAIGMSGGSAITTVA